MHEHNIQASFVLWVVLNRRFAVPLGLEELLSGVDVSLLFTWSG